MYVRPQQKSFLDLVPLRGGERLKVRCLEHFCRGRACHSTDQTVVTNESLSERILSLPNCCHCSPSAPRQFQGVLADINRCAPLTRKLDTVSSYCCKGPRSIHRLD